MSLSGLDLKAVGPRIRMMMPNLTPLEAKVVETVFGRRRFDESIPLKEIAGESGVSEAMVVKIAKKLGFSGYREFRTAVYEYSRLPTAEMHRELSFDDGPAEIVQKVFRTSIQALEETLAILDIAEFDRAADLLYRARTRDFYGVGGSAQIARDVSHKFLRIGIRASVYDDSHMMLMSASLLGADDIAVGFSHSGNTSAVIDAIQLADNRTRGRSPRTCAAAKFIKLSATAILADAAGEIRASVGFSPMLIASPVLILSPMFSAVIVTAAYLQISI